MSNTGKRPGWWRKFRALPTGAQIAAWIGLAAVIIIASVLGRQSSATPTSQHTPLAPATTSAAPSPTPTPTTSPPPACSQPCADANGWVAQLSNFRFGVKSGNQFITPERGNVFVTVEVTFINRSNRSHTAAPTDFKLKSGGVEHSAEFVGPCGAWSSVNISPGASYGPKCVAFQAAANQPSGSVVEWRPGLIQTYDIPVS